MPNGDEVDVIVAGRAGSTTLHLYKEATGMGLPLRELPTALATAEEGTVTVEPSPANPLRQSGSRRPATDQQAPPPAPRLMVEALDTAELQGLFQPETWMKMDTTSAGAFAEIMRQKYAVTSVPWAKRTVEDNITLLSNQIQMWVATKGMIMRDENVSVYVDKLVTTAWLTIKNCDVAHFSAGDENDRAQSEARADVWRELMGRVTKPQNVFAELDKALGSKVLTSTYTRMAPRPNQRNPKDFFRGRKGRRPKRKGQGQGESKSKQ